MGDFNGRLTKYLSTHGQKVTYITPEQQVALASDINRIYCDLYEEVFLKRNGPAPTPPSPAPNRWIVRATMPAGQARGNHWVCAPFDSFRSPSKEDRTAQVVYSRQSTANGTAARLRRNGPWTDITIVPAYQAELIEL